MRTFGRCWPQGGPNLAAARRGSRSVAGRLAGSSGAARRSLGFADHGDYLAAVEDRDEVIRAMRPLTAHQRAALVLTGYLGYSSEEAAQVLGVRASTVRALATKGRATARATVEGRR
jgi:DNA-directed RNA polymerase specialized sigma24 family protein